MRFNIKEMKKQGIFLGILAGVLAVIILVSSITSNIKTAPTSDETPTSSENGGADNEAVDNTTQNDSHANNTENTNNKDNTDKTETVVHKHNWIRGNTVAPTCKEGGYTINTCSCGESKPTNEKAALGHKFGEWTVKTEPTETADGLKERVCEICKELEQEKIDKLTSDNSGEEEIPDETPEDGEKPEDEKKPENTDDEDKNTDGKDENTDGENDENTPPTV